MTTGAGNAVFVDTNLLVYAAVSQSPFHAIALGALAALYSGMIDIWVSRQVLREYLAVLTRPQRFTGPLSPSLLASDIGNFQRRFRVAEDSLAVTERLLQLMQQIPMGGKQVHDANIVATMLVHGVPRLLTANAGDFARFGHLITIEPLS